MSGSTKLSLSRNQWPICPVKPERRQSV